MDSSPQINSMYRMNSSSCRHPTDERRQVDGLRWTTATSFARRRLMVEMFRSRHIFGKELPSTGRTLAKVAPTCAAYGGLMKVKGMLVGIVAVAMAASACGGGGGGVRQQDEDLHGREHRAGAPHTRQHERRVRPQRRDRAVRHADDARHERQAGAAGRRVGRVDRPEGLDDQDQAGADLPQRRAGHRAELRRRLERHGRRDQRLGQQLLPRHHRRLRRAQPRQRQAQDAHAQAASRSSTRRPCR